MISSKILPIIESEKVTLALKVIRAAYDEMFHMNLGPWNIRYAMLLTMHTDAAAAKNQGVASAVLDQIDIKAKQDYTNFKWKIHWTKPTTRRTKD